MPRQWWRPSSGSLCGFPSGDYLRPRSSVYCGPDMAVVKAVWNKPLQSSLYQPQTNGLCERFNGMLRQLLQTFATSHWDLGELSAAPPIRLQGSAAGIYGVLPI